MSKNGEEDEIGLWTIEKRVSFSVSGRTGNSQEFERTDSNGSERGLRRTDNGDGNGAGAAMAKSGIVVSREVEIVRDHADSDEDRAGDRTGDGREFGGRVTQITAGRSLARRDSSRNRF